MIGAQWIRLAAMSVCLTLGCSDSTAPAGTVEVIVSPDTIRLTANGDATIWYARRNLSSSPVRVLAERIDVQTEIAPGDWRTLADSLDPYVQFALRDAETATAQGDVAGIWTVTTVPGRYRLRYWYQLARADGTGSGDHRTVDSNAFVVIPRGAASPIYVGSYSNRVAPP